MNSANILITNQGYNLRLREHKIAFAQGNVIFLKKQIPSYTKAFGHRPVNK